jgi:MoaA/NifB/PqqE/SkfB family radical SAM enzyme
MSVASQLKDLKEKVKFQSIEWVASQALSLLSKVSDNTLIRTANLLERLALTEEKRNTVRTVRKAFENKHPSIQLAKRLLRELHPNCRRGVVVGFIIRSIFADKLRVAYRDEYGYLPPFVVLISPTMRCNLRCSGCFAGEYDVSSDLKPEVIDRVCQEMKAIGINFVTILGGEPFVYQPLWDIFARHQDVVFQVFTNGTLIDRQLAERIVSLGNVALCFSLEGFEEKTDARRGEGTFRKVMQGMDYMREAGGLFFYSVTTTKDNVEESVSDEFIDLMIEKGAALGWYFNYIPVGRRPDFENMPTPEQRNYVRKKVAEIRSRKPILLVDFWGDGPLVGGCLAGGKLYLHINNRGDVEPCIFCHVATDNIKEKSLVECLNSDFFKAIRAAQPFGHNDIRPCPLIDHPGAMASLAKKYGAYLTHPGADCLFEEMLEPLEKYAEKVATIYRDVWEKEYSWVKKWRQC